MARDEELDAAQRELNGVPHIDKPDEIRAGLSCWLNQNRICQSDCMAFDPEAPEGSFDCCRILAAAQGLIPVMQLAQRPMHPAPVSIQDAIRGVAPPSVGGGRK